MNNTWLNWLFDELTHIQQFPGPLATGHYVVFLQQSGRYPYMGTRGVYS